MEETPAGQSPPAMPVWQDKDLRNTAEEQDRPAFLSGYRSVSATASQGRKIARRVIVDGNVKADLHYITGIPSPNSVGIDYVLSLPVGRLSHDNER